MAKKRKGRGTDGVNKSAEVRNYLAANPTAGPSETSDALKKMGIDATPQLVSNIKAKLGLVKKRRKRKKGARATAVAAAALGGMDSGVSEAALKSLKKNMREVAKLSKQLGGYDQVRVALDVLREFQS